MQKGETINHKGDIMDTKTKFEIFLRNGNRNFTLIELLVEK